MANQNLYLCLLDCSAIQQYVFGSNMLKSNAGASHVVTLIYDAWIPEVLAEMYQTVFEKTDEHYKSWRQEKWINVLRLEQDPNLQWETGYVGGGNALMLFREQEHAARFIREWTRKLLTRAPGIRPVVARCATTIDDLRGAGTGIQCAFDELAKNKNAYVPSTHLPRHGITAECKISGLSADVFAQFPDGDLREVSSVSKTKLEYFEDANRALAAKFQSILGDQYEFASDTENLGQSKNVENHVAIVHIDGNGVGKMFEECHSLFEKRRLSREVDSLTHEAMEKTLNHLLEKMPILKEKEILQWKPPKKGEKQSGKALLPLRPIILNGDDITFICDSRLGFFLAEKFMQAFAAKKVDAPIAHKYLSSCAGLAIIKTKYPFYRGYLLAEELCRNAKAAHRKMNDNSSWLDFHISYTGLSEKVSQIRERKYKSGNDSLVWRPWKMTSAEEMEAYSQFKKILRHFLQPESEESAWPKSKIHELAEVLARGTERTKAFLIAMEARGLTLPRIKQAENAHKNGWQAINKNGHEEMKTPYYDAIEAMPFYPECLL